MAIAGDSFVAGVGATHKRNGYSRIVADRTELHPVVIACGGAGFINPGPSRFGIHRGPYSRQRWRMPWSPTVEIIQASANDRFYEGSQVEGAIYSYLWSVRKPTMTVLVGPIWCGDGRECLRSVEAAAKSAAARAGIVFFPGSRWIPDENTDSYLATDGGHLNDLGHSIVAWRLLADLQATWPNLNIAAAR